MVFLILGLILFLGMHSVSIIRPALRVSLVGRLGEAGWSAVFGLVSVAGLLLLIWGYGMTREAPTVLYSPPTWMRHLNLLLMLPIFIFLFAAYLPGRIQTSVKHPMLLAVKIWAFGHLLANGNLADVLLFGGFLAWGVADRISLKRRVPPPVKGAPAGPRNDLIAIVGGISLYLLFVVWLHKALIGVAPIG